MMELGGDTWFQVCEDDWHVGLLCSRKLTSNFVDFIILSLAYGYLKSLYSDSYK
jgi:hypothetical protein